MSRRPFAAPIWRSSLESRRGSPPPERRSRRYPSVTRRKSCSSKPSLCSAGPMRPSPRWRSLRRRGHHYSAPGRYPGISQPILWDPSLRPLWSDPRFPAFLQRVGFFAYWRASRSRPDICRAASPPPFCGLLVDRRDHHQHEQRPAGANAFGFGCRARAIHGPFPKAGMGPVLGCPLSTHCGHWPCSAIQEPSEAITATDRQPARCNCPTDVARAATARSGRRWRTP